MQLGIARSAELESWRADMQATVDSAIARAQNAPWPEVSTLFDLV